MVNFIKLLADVSRSSKPFLVDSCSAYLHHNLCGELYKVDALLKYHLNFFIVSTVSESCEGIFLSLIIFSSTFFYINSYIFGKTI